MSFNKYMHLERLGTSEVEGIEIGTCHVFPKLDGTNASVWMDECGNIKAGSRNRELTQDNDNAGFCSWVKENEDQFKVAFKGKESLTLFGEWLVPHSLKTYREDAWRRFYIFDVYDRTTNKYVVYDLYKQWLDDSGFNYLSPMATIKNGEVEHFEKCLEKNTHYIKDGFGIGEGVVIKNYSWENKYGRVVWAKLITNSFKEKHQKEMGPPEIGGVSLEESIVEEFVTKHLVDKVHAKVSLEDGWSSKMIGKLLGLVWHDFVTEEIWEVLKKHKNPKLDFKRLQQFTIYKVKELRSDLF